MILCAPAAIAAPAPRALGTSTATVRPGIVLAWATISAVSASCGRTLAGTKLPTSISDTPAAASALIQDFLAAVGMTAWMLCRPSRGPTSLTRTSTVGTMEPYSAARARGARHTGWIGAGRPVSVTQASRRSSTTGP